MRTDSRAVLCGHGAGACIVEQGDVWRIAEAPVAGIARHFIEYAELDETRHQAVRRREGEPLFPGAAIAYRLQVLVVSLPVLLEVV